jgi:hypothetical protein
MAARTSEELSFKEKLRTLSFSRPSARGPKVTTDELGHTTTEHWDDRVDVTISAPHVTAQMGPAGG